MPAGDAVKVLGVREPLAVVREVHALTYERDVVCEEEGHRRDFHRPILARVVEHGLVGGDAVPTNE